MCSCVQVFTKCRTQSGWIQVQKPLGREWAPRGGRCGKAGARLASVLGSSGPFDQGQRESQSGLGWPVRPCCDGSFPPASPRDMSRWLGAELWGVEEGWGGGLSRQGDPVSVMSTVHNVPALSTMAGSPGSRPGWTPWGPRHCRRQSEQTASLPRRCWDREGTDGGPDGWESSRNQTHCCHFSSFLTHH